MTSSADGYGAGNTFVVGERIGIDVASNSNESCLLILLCRTAMALSH
jgi:hypothetical protein